MSALVPPPSRAGTMTASSRPERRGPLTIRPISAGVASGTSAGMKSTRSAPCATRMARSPA